MLLEEEGEETMINQQIMEALNQQQELKSQSTPLILEFTQIFKVEEQS